MMIGCKKTEDLLKDWPLWVKRVFAFARVESRPIPSKSYSLSMKHPKTTSLAKMVSMIDYMAK